MKAPFLRLFILAIVTALAARAPELRLGMVGLDTSHVVVYLKLFNDPKNKDYIPGGKIVAAFKGGSASTARRTAVLRPENEKSHPGLPFMGRGNAKRVASPFAAARSIAGPPG